MKTTSMSSKSVESNHVHTQQERVTTAHIRQTFTGRDATLPDMNFKEDFLKSGAKESFPSSQFFDDPDFKSSIDPKTSRVSQHTEVSSVMMHQRQHHESSTVSKTESVVNKPVMDELKNNGPCLSSSKDEIRINGPCLSSSKDEIRINGPCLYRVTRTITSKRDEETILRERIQAAEDHYYEVMREKFGSSNFQIPSFQSLFDENVKDLDFRHAPPLSGNELTSFISKVREHGRSSYEKEENHATANSTRHARVTAEAEIKDDNKHASVNTSKNERQTHQVKEPNREHYSESNFKQTTSRKCYNSEGLKEPDKVVSNMLTKPIGKWTVEEWPGAAASAPTTPSQSQMESESPFTDTAPAVDEEPQPPSPLKRALSEPTPQVVEPSIQVGTGPQRILWSQLPEVVDSGVLQSMTKKQIVIKEREYEIFTTQITYCASMQVLVEHFYNNPRFACNKTAETEQPPLIDSYQKLNLFLNCLKLHLSSQELLQSLFERWQTQTPMFEEVCDIIRDHFKNEPGYKYYIRNMPSQAHMLQALCQNEEFRKVLTELECDDQCRKLPLLSFLSAPFKRITQLRLMLENLIKEMQRERNYCKESVIRHAEHAYNILSNLLYEVEREKKLLDDNECRILLSTRLIYDVNYKTLDLSCQSLDRQDTFRILKPRTLNPWQKSDVVLILLSNLIIVSKMRKDRKLRVLDHCSRDKAHVKLSRLFSEEGTPANEKKSDRKPPRKSASLPDATAPIQNTHITSSNVSPVHQFSRDMLLDETVSLPNSAETDMSFSMESYQQPRSTKFSRFQLVFLENHFGVRREMTLQANHPGIAMCWSTLLPCRCDDSTRKKVSKRRTSSFKTCIAKQEE